MDKLIVSKPLSVGYLYSVAELKSGAYPKSIGHNSQHATSSSVAPKISVIRDDGSSNAHGTVEYELPHVPSWFVHASSQRLYFALAGMVRLVGLSTVSGNFSTTVNALPYLQFRSCPACWLLQQCSLLHWSLTCNVLLPVMLLGQGTSASLSVFVDILLNQFRRLSTELRAKDTQRYGVQRWYMKSDSGQILRQASSAVCMLNELIYGLSDQSLRICLQLFNKRSAQVVGLPGQNDKTSSGEHSGVTDSREVWKISEEMGTKDDVIHCIGSILHEYMSPEVWDLPTEQKSELCLGETSLPLHLFRDTTALQQVIMHRCSSSIVLLLKFFLCLFQFQLYFKLCSASGNA
jgi:hypothetical protein